MHFELQLCSLMLVFLLIVKLWLDRKHKSRNKFPAGPIPIPIIGNLLLFSKNQPLEYVKLKERYGDIFSIQLGNQSIVVISSASLLRRAFIKKTVTGRPHFDDLPKHTGGQIYGIAFQDGLGWQEQKSFFVKSMKDDFNLSFPRGEKIVAESLQGFVEKLTSQQGNPVHTEDLYPTFGVDVLWTIFTGRNVLHDDPKFSKFVKSHKRVIWDTDSILAGLYLPNIKQVLPWLFRDVPIKKRMEHHEELLNVMRADLGICKDNPERAEDDLIKRYMGKIESTTDKFSSFFGKCGELNMMYSLLDAFTASTVALSNALSWLCILMSLTPSVQSRLFKEIEKNIGLSRLPNLKDKKMLPFAQAVVLEVLRFGSISAIGGPRQISDDLELDEYILPAGTSIFGNLYGIMHDPAVWGDPEIFRPERFLNSDGQNVSETMLDYLVPFSVGRRSCPAEYFVKDLIFLFVVTIFQKFTVSLDPNTPLSNNLHSFAFFNSPKPHKIVFTPIKPNQI